MTDPFAPGQPDGPPVDHDAIDTDALQARREAAETLLRGVTDAARYLHQVTIDSAQETKDRITAARALLGFSGVDRIAGRPSGHAPGTDPLSALDALLSGKPRSRWAASAVGRQRCPEPSCDWPAHRGGEMAHGHTIEAGYQDGCGFRHSMMASCGPVPEGQSTRSDFWETVR